MNAKGFTLVEIVIVTAIILLLAGIAVITWNTMRDSSTLRAESDALVFYLEESKARSVAGTGGEAHGVHIESDRYTQFDGSAYSAGDSDNVVHTIDSDLILSIAGGASNSVLFSRITGVTGNTATITVALRSNASTTRTIVVGSGGDISVVQ